MLADASHVSLVAVNALENENVQIDFKPLYLCILIYDTLDAREELQLSYQADRRVSCDPLLHADAHSVLTDLPLTLRRPKLSSSSPKRLP